MKTFGLEAIFGLNSSKNRKTSTSSAQPSSAVAKEIAARKAGGVDNRFKTPSWEYDRRKTARWEFEVRKGKESPKVA